ncbi:universal stress protein [Salinigranum halophilum]|jgi:nucleotide-binding universal stress UspA family protein|uniref:universal stress protein n=1 Tax=Salinigranum halophilum TaxID=2565931 RepID=UPI0010A789E5
MYDTLLVPTDGSPGSERAVEHAVELAETYDATLHTLYVVDDSQVPVAGAEALDDDLSARGKEAIDVVRTRAADSDVAFVSALRRGDPTQEILGYRDEIGADMIIMGTHGRTGLERHLLGSVTEQVVRSSPVPVVTVGLRTPTDAVPSEESARTVAREALVERYGEEAVALDEGAYNERHAWVFEGNVEDRHATVYVDRSTGEPRIVTAPED